MSKPRESPQGAKATYFNRDFGFALAGYFCLYLSISLFYIYPLFFKAFHASQGRIGLIMGITSVSAIGIRPFFGPAVDRQGGKRIALFGLALMAVCLPFFHFVRDAGLLPLALRAFLGLGWGVSMMATIAVCTELAPLEKLAQSIGIVGVAGLIGNSIGPVLGEEIVRRAGFGALFDAGLVLLLLAIVFLAAIREPIRVPGPAGEAPSRKLLSVVSLGALVLMGMMTVAHGAVRSSVVYFIALFGKSIGLPRVGPFFLVFSGAAILTRLGIGDISDRIGRKRVIFPAALIIAFNLLVISQVRGMGLFLTAGFVAGFGQGLIYPALSTYIIDMMGRANRGLALSFYLSLFDVGMSAGAPFFGWVSDLGGYRRMYMAAAGFLFAVAVIFQRLAPRAAGGPVAGRERTSPAYERSQT
jgi:MFS family permease